MKSKPGSQKSKKRSKQDNRLFSMVSFEYQSRNYDREEIFLVVFYIVHCIELQEKRLQCLDRLLGNFTTAINVLEDLFALVDYTLNKISI